MNMKMITHINTIKNIFQNIYKISSIRFVPERNLGRWNSVMNRVPIEENKYIDWGNMDHCCCSPAQKIIKINN